MNPIYFCLLGLLALQGAAAVTTASADNAEQQKLQLKDVDEEMQLINKSLEGLLSELAVIKREATGRLSQVKKASSSVSSPAGPNENERIRQTKVSRFVLRRVAELESESLGMRDEMVKLFALQRKSSTRAPVGPAASPPLAGAQLKLQEDHDFDELPPASPAAPTTTTTTSTTTSTMKPSQQQQEQEAAQIGFDLEQLKRLGNELEGELEARQGQSPESIRGVHEQIIRLTDQMVQNYLGSMRRVIHRFNNLLGDNRRSGLTPNSSGQQHAQAPKESAAPTGSEQPQLGGGGEPAAVVGKLEGITRQFAEFSEEFPKALGRQSSPLIDRIPPRGVELWRDFWDTVRKQFRRINQEFLQVSRDMGRLLTGRRPSTGSERVVVVRPREGELAGDKLTPSARQAESAPLAHLLYASNSPLSSGEESTEAVERQFQEFYDKLSAQLRVEQHKMNELGKAGAAGSEQQQLTRSKQQVDELIEELDDEQTRKVLTQNPGLRQQINQDINVFSSIFDIIRTFLTRLRGSAEDIRNILERPGAMRDNNSVTPGPAVKPTVDQLLKDTVDSQRNINGQAKPAGRR